MAAALKDAELPELTWYTVLWELERAGKPTRPKDLAIPLFILPYQLSRLVDRMEKDGLVKRIDCEEDKRGHLLEPTAKGFALRKRCGRSTPPPWTTRCSRIADPEALKLAELLNKLGGIEQSTARQGLRPSARTRDNARSGSLCPRHGRRRPLLNAKRGSIRSTS